MMRCKFKDWECGLKFGLHANGGTAIQLISLQEPFDLIAIATKNLPIKLLSIEVAIKDYSENEGMLQALIDAGVVHPPHKYYKTEYVVFPICEITEETAIQIIKEIEYNDK